MFRLISRRTDEELREVLQLLKMLLLNTMMANGGRLPLGGGGGGLGDVVGNVVNALARNADRKRPPDDEEDAKE